MKLNRFVRAITIAVLSLGVCQSMDPAPGNGSQRGGFPPNVLFASLEGTLFDRVDRDVLKIMEGYKQAPFPYTQENLNDLASASGSQIYLFLRELANITQDRFDKKIVGDYQIIENMFPPIISEKYIKENCGSMRKNIDDIFNYFIIDTDNSISLSNILCKVPSSRAEKISSKNSVEKQKKTGRSQSSDIITNAGLAKKINGSVQQLKLSQTSNIFLYIVKYEYFSDEFSSPFVLFLGKYYSDGF